MKCIIIDDEPLARKGLTKLVKEVPFLELAGAYGDSIQAISVLEKENINLLFLDIEMPKMTGIDFLKTVRNLPITIITTAYPDYALQSYELDVVDYLLKPVSLERFVKSVTRAKELYDLRNKQIQTTSDSEGDYIFIKSDSRIEKIMLEDILFIESLQNYVAIHTTEKKHVAYLTLKSLEEQLDSSRFIKVNKSNIIPLNKIDAVTGNIIHIGTHNFSISRKNKDEVLDKITGNKLIKRL